MREKREMAGKEGSNSTKLRHYGAFVLIPLLLGGREMRIDATVDEREKSSRKEASFNGTPLPPRRHRRRCSDAIVSRESHLTEII